MEYDYDVAVIGLGPVGATVSSLLGRAGVRVVALERDPDVFPLPRAAHLDHMSLRTLQELELLDELLPEMIENQGLDLVTADRQLLARIPGLQRSVSNLPASMYFYQPDFDRALRRCAEGVPSVECRSGVEVTDVVTAADSVQLQFRDGGSATVRYAVGCDGSWSTVRDAVGLAYDDLGFHEPWIAVDLLLDEPKPELPIGSVQVCDPRRPHLAVPMPGSRYRFEFMVLPGEDPDELKTPESVAKLVEPWLGSATATVERAAVYTFRGLICPSWRAGRVLIAGDAAHLMPPFLGQGMCSGMRDASNLAWKLARVINGLAPESLLDTYTSEREPHVRHVTESAMRIGRAMCELDPVAAAKRDSEMLSDVTPPEGRIIFKLQDLTSGPLVRDGGGKLFIQPEIDGGRLDDVVGARFLVLLADGAPLPDSASWWSEEMAALVATPSELGDETGDLAGWLAARDAQFAIVRPDRFVLASGSNLDAVTLEVAPVLALA